MEPSGLQRGPDEVVFRLMRQGLVTGLRIDHVDGLLDPLKYLSNLQREAQGRKTEAHPFYVVVEKILGHDELLRREWPVQGTTGYEFLNDAQALFVGLVMAGAAFLAGLTAEQRRHAWGKPNKTSPAPQLSVA